MIKESEKFAAASIMEGMVSLDSVIKGRENGTNNRKIEKVLFDTSKKASKSRTLSYIERKAAEHGFIVEMCEKERIEKMALGTSHGGILAICSERSFHAFSAPKKKDGFYVMIEGIEDPYNFGYAMRSLYAAGVDGIILSPRNWMSAAGVVARASAGASELFEISISDSPQNAAYIMKENGYKVVCADTENAESVYSADLSFPLFLIVGGEKRGISRATLELADSVVRLDYGRDFPAALSAASAASILAFEIMRKNKF